ncbi:YncE family protein [Alteromonas oceanisediminis]|uniref:YncE family protein n=1 Tax=Alteromonas oceanisediminis TaxID=2836180 RepID=UPI001BDB0F08|nr:YncE family protein [Alteromonas oceanisediminis]MBT0586941.1 YncE family protein [Alteromonas oceanisediminis]
MKQYVRAAFMCFALLGNHFAMASDKSIPLDGQIWVVNKRGDNVSVIDVGLRSIIATLPTGKGPHELAIDSDSQRAVVTDYVGGNSLTVYDIAALNVERTISLAKYPRPHGVLFMPDQEHVAVSSEGSDTAVIVNVQTGEIAKVLPTQAQGSHMVALPASGDVIYTTNMSSNSVSVLNVGDEKLSHKLAMPTTPEAITVDARNSTLWVGSNKDGWLSVYNVHSEALVKQWKDYLWPYRILYSPDETVVVVPDLRQNTLDIINVDGFERLHRMVLPDGSAPKGVTFHPNGDILFLSLYDANKVAVIDIRSAKILFTLPTGDGPDGLGYVPQR